MAVYRPQYKDKKTGKMKHTKVWYYEFLFAGRLVKESAKTTSKTIAKLAEQARPSLRRGSTGFRTSGGNGSATSPSWQTVSLRIIACYTLSRQPSGSMRSAMLSEYWAG